MDAGDLQSIPTWLRAVLFGLVAGVGLPAGAAAALTGRIHHRGVAQVMAFGSGTLLGVVSIQLTIEAQRHSGVAGATLALLVGASFFSGINLWLSRRGAMNRKRCGECVAQPTEAGEPGSGRAIAIGTIVDAVPEGLVLGVAVARGMSPTLAVVVAFFLANLPEALSATAGMIAAGRSRRYVLALWTAAAAITPAAAVVGAVLLVASPPAVQGMLEAFSGGVLLTMAAETMIPEAFERSPAFSGAIAVLGFACIVALAAL
jgi:ZIP family zinc transporter